MFNRKLLERILGDVISDILVDVSKDKTLFTLLDCPLCSIPRIFLGGVLVKVIPKKHDLGHVFRHIDQASSSNSGLHYDVPGKSEKLLFV